MNQRIILADNSYTIRRIVELSFQDIENVELLSFENGVGLKDKILEFLPQVVLIDIKLPDFSGYDACKFINNEPLLVNTKVLLMKGGFEPIDEYLLKDLNYEDIITKPFDSKLLETQVIKLLKEVEAIAPIPPVSVPEDLDMPTFSDNFDEEIAIETNIDTESFPDSIPEFNEDQESDGISFSDVNEEIVNEENKDAVLKDEKNDMSFEDAVAEIETPEILSENELLNDNVSVMDEVEPSEEITQGAYEESNDSLSSDPDDEFLNPFNDEPLVNTDEINLKEHIKEHEEDLGIDSLTIEEMRIKSEIENRNKGIDKEEDDFGTDTFGGLEKQPDFDNISFDEDEEKEAVKVDEENVVKENIVEEIQVEKIDKSIFEAAEGILNDDISMLEEDENNSIEKPLIDEEVIATADTAKSSESEELFGSTDDSMQEENDNISIEKPVIDEEVSASVDTAKSSESEELFGSTDDGMLEEDENISTEKPVINEEVSASADTAKSSDLEELFSGQNAFIEEKTPEVTPEQPVLEKEELPDNIAESIGSTVSAGTDNLEDNVSYDIIPEVPEVDSVPIIEEKIEEPLVEQEEIIKPEEKIDEPLIEQEEITTADEVNLFEQKEMQEDVPVEKIIEEPVEPIAESTIVEVDMKKVMASVEDKLTLSIKEILWEIIPPLAEKIIKEEIASLKSEIDNKEF